ncbi:hypothetical protein INR49_009553, partial [Caranx melampygus]
IVAGPVTVRDCYIPLNPLHFSSSALAAMEAMAPSTPEGVASTSKQGEATANVVSGCDAPGTSSHVVRPAVRQQKKQAERKDVKQRTQRVSKGQSISVIHSEQVSVGKDSGSVSVEGNVSTRPASSIQGTFHQGDTQFKYQGV